MIPSLAAEKRYLKDLPREQTFLYLTDEEKTCAKSTFFAKVKEDLDIVPAKIRVLEYMQRKRSLMIKMTLNISSRLRCQSIRFLALSVALASSLTSFRSKVFFNPSSTYYVSSKM